MDSDQVFGGFAALFGGTFLIFILALIILALASWWKVFTKAGQPGWAAIIPIYNMVVLMNIIGRPAWWVLLMFIPLVNIVIAIIAHIELAKSFGQGTGFGIGLVLLGIVFFPILAFGTRAIKGRWMARLTRRRSWRSEGPPVSTGPGFLNSAAGRP